MCEKNRSARSVCRLVAALLLLFAAAAPIAGVAAAEERKPFEFTPARHGEGSLEMIGNVPVVVVRGTPRQMGEQLGALLAGPLHDMNEREEAIVEGFGLPAHSPLLLSLGTVLADRVPPAHLAEMKAVAKSAGIRYDFLLAGNVGYDIAKIGGCSALLIDGAHSATGEVVFGRNMDFPNLGFLDRVGVVVVYHGQGKHAFASVTFPGYLGCLSGMNDAGLAVAQLEVNEAGDGSPRFDPTGTPLSFSFRRVLEECATVEEAEKLLGTFHRTSMCNMAICDPKTVAVFELTHKDVMRREAEAGFCACTNHFRTDRLGPPRACRRYESLSQAFGSDRLSLADVQHKLDQANQGELTIQTMIFEPAALELRLALGAPPVSARPLQAIDLAPLLKGEAKRER
ncbi:MAG TPA: C45 family peptidase [Pirellulales bacterium]|nr:C45 family peptidase [Pirellulales bacterium]